MHYLPLVWLAPSLWGGQIALPPDLVFSVRQWEGEYATSDEPGGVRTTPVTSAIYGVRADGSGRHKIASLGAVTDHPTFSPDGQWLYFQSNASGRYDIYRCRPDGADVTSVVDRESLAPEWNDAYGYALSADGSRMVYTVHNGTLGKVVVASADGSSPRLVAPELGYIYMAALDATGSSVVFSGPARGYRLLRVDLPDGKPLLLTPDHPESFAPQFTPDGQTIVFVRRDGDVYSVGRDGDGLRRLTEGNRYVEFRLSEQDEHGSTDGPCLSPDGRRIAYVALRDGVPNVCAMGLDGSDQRQLTSRPTPCGRVRWSPDGDWIAFVSFEGKYPQLFVVPASGGEPRQITDVDGAVYLLSWRP
jgi:Tol biopolymer transport system component